MQSVRFLLAVDPSLTCSGWALFARQNGRVLAVGKVRSDPPKRPLGERLTRLQQRVEKLLDHLSLGEGDVLVCEAPTTMRDPQAAFKVEQARGIFESAARARNVSVPGRINPRSVHFEVMGMTGKQLRRDVIKGMAVRTAIALYRDDLAQLGLGEDEAGLEKHQDIVDAVLLGRLALGRVHEAGVAGTSLEEIFMNEGARGRLRRRMVG